VERIPIAIIGNGGAAAEAVLALRASRYNGEIHLFADNEHAPYNPMLGPYIVAGKIPAERAFPFGDNAVFYASKRVTTHLGKPVVRLDAETRRLATASGEIFEYERCLVATGARPVVPPTPGLREALGIDATPHLQQKAATEERPAPTDRRVFTIQTLDEALALRRCVEALMVAHRPAREAKGELPRSGPGQEVAGGPPGAGPPRAAVIGASFAGLKMAAVLHDLGFSVTLVEREPSILPLAAHPDCARLMEAHLLEEGYSLRLGAALAGVTVEATASEGRRGVRLEFGALPGAADPGGAGGSACEESPTQETVDLVLVCTGTRPSLGFLAPGQVEVGTGILVDEQMRSSIPTLYAAGDVAQGKNLLSGRHEIIGLWSSARYQGRAAGRSLADSPAEYRGGVPHNITHVGRMLFASVGCVDQFDRMVACRDGDGYQFRVWQDGRLAGVNLLNCCLSAGVTRQAILRAAGGATTDTEATWTSFSG
jgi:NADPH-dependent 2,4-dienoyl-CoA reductase/sulfur reductase-like enzyme